MNSTSPATTFPTISPSRAARIAGIGVVIMVLTGPFAEMYAYPTVVSGSIEQITQNIMTHRGLFAAAISGYFVMFLCDVLVAWALYLVLAPVNRALSLLAGWLRMVYGVIALVSLMNLVTVLRMLGRPDYLETYGADIVHGQVRLLLNSFQYPTGLNMMIFGIYLGLLGALVYRSGYIPRIMGGLLMFGGVAWTFDALQPLLFPGVNLGLMWIASIGELIFVGWLLIRGGRIPNPAIRETS